MTLQDLLDRLGDREDVTITGEEWTEIVHNFNPSEWEGFEPTTKLCFMEAGIVAWLLPHVTGRDRNVKVRMPEIEGRFRPATIEEIANLLKEHRK